LFRLLRLQSSPLLRKVLTNAENKKRKTVRCSRCRETGHKKSSKKCPLFDSLELGDEVEDGETETEGADIADITGISLIDSDDEDIDDFGEDSDHESLVGSDDSDQEGSLEVTTVILAEDNTVENIF
jgi:hypothetical protein